MRENFQVKDNRTGKVYWISRAMAVTTILIKGDKILFQKRGTGCPDNVGKLCCSCGYLNWDETLSQAAIRELYEETGILISEKDLKFWKIIDDPKRDDKQNVTVRFYASIDENTPTFTSTDTKSRGGEDNEVESFVWLTPSEVLKMSPNDFAFNHYDMIKELIKEKEREI